MGYYSARERRIQNLGMGVDAHGVEMDKLYSIGTIDHA